MSTRARLSLFFLIFFSACISTSKKELQQIDETMIVDGLEKITIDMKAGELMINAAEDESFQIIGYVSGPKSLELVRDGSLLEIIHENSTEYDKFQIYIPDNIELIIDTFSADLALKDLTGDINVRSVGGSIQVENFDGFAQIWSGRGNVTILGGFGKAVIIGEHGSLTAKNFSGDLSMSTIMGSIEYLAPMYMDKIVRLETDHGPVSATLSGDVNADVIVSSTSGPVNCAGKDISLTLNGCSGILDNGEGELFIRTVSGRVELTVDEHPGRD